MYFLKLPGGVTFFPVRDLSTREMTWNVGASYFLCKSGNFAISSLEKRNEQGSMMTNLLRQVELRIDLFILWPLRNEERVPCRPLSDGRVETENKLNVEIVDFGKEKYAMDRREGDAIICTLAK